MGMAEDSPLRDPGQIPYPAPLPPSQSQANVADEEETTSMKELVQAIDAHIDPEVSNTLWSKRLTPISYRPRTYPIS